MLLLSAIKKNVDPTSPEFPLLENALSNNCATSMRFKNKIELSKEISVAVNEGIAEKARREMLNNFEERFGENIEKGEV